MSTVAIDDAKQEKQLQYTGLSRFLKRSFSSTVISDGRMNNVPAPEKAIIVARKKPTVL